MTRKLHPTCTPEEITEKLVNTGFKIPEISNKIRKTKIDGKVKIAPL